MAISSTRNISVAFTGDVYANETLAAATNVSSPGAIAVVSLLSGNNTIAIPSGATACTIMKPATNAVQLTVKGVISDTGVQLSLTDPDSISFATGTTSFCLNAASAVTVHLIWS